MKDLSNLVRDFIQTRNKLITLYKALPRVAGNEAVREVKKNFTQQHYDLGSGTEAWKPRTKWTNARYDARKGVKGSVYNSKNPLLLQTRNLYNGIHYVVIGTRAYVGVNLALVPYARDLNEGNPSKRLPPRKFIPIYGEKIPNIEKAFRGRYDIMFKEIMKDFKK